MSARKNSRPAASAGTSIIVSKAPASTGAPAATETAEDEEDQPVVIPDILQNLPELTVGNFKIFDLTAVEEVSQPRKYENVHKKAKEAGLHMKPGWKYASSTFKIGVRRDVKTGSVFDNLMNIVSAYGTHVPAVVLCTRLRKSSVGNKRSHFCDQLPPIGWAEGYVQGAIAKGYIKVAGSYDTGLATDVPVTAPAQPETPAAPVPEEPDTEVKPTGSEVTETPAVVPPAAEPASE